MTNTPEFSTDEATTRVLKSREDSKKQMNNRFAWKLKQRVDSEAAHKVCSKLSQPKPAA